MVDLLATCDRSFRDGLRVGGECFLLRRSLEFVKKYVRYDPSSETGLRWLASNYSDTCPNGHRAGDAVGKSFFIGKSYFVAPRVVLALHNIWPEDGQNVVTRKDPSGPWGDVANLEWAVHGDGRRRSAELARVALVRSVLGDSLPDLDDRHRLAKPCKKGHHWNGHPLGLYVKHGDGWRCKQCQIEKHQNPIEKQKKKQRRDAWYLDNLEDQRQKARERMSARLQDPKQRRVHNERTKQCMARKRQTVGRVSSAGLLVPPNLLGHGLLSRDLQAFADAGWDISTIDPATISESRKLWLHLKNSQPALTVAQLVEKQSKDVIDEEKAEYLENGGTEEEWAKEYKRRYYYFKMATDDDYVLRLRERSRRRKARIRASRRQSLHPVTRAQIDARFALWDNRCAFCGVDANHPRNKGYDRLTVEHVLALTKGGLDEASNILPACLACNLGKHNAPVETWYRQQPFFTDARWRKIQKHCHAAVAGQLPLALL